MVIRLGRNGRFLACSLYPEHKEIAAAAGRRGRRPRPATGEVCPKCGEGTLVGKRGRFGPFVGCSRYPDCDYIKKEGPPPPDPLPFEVVCPKNNDGHLVTRRARRTGNVFWGARAIRSATSPRTSSRSAAVHDADDGPRRAQGRRRRSASRAAPTIAARPRATICRATAGGRAAQPRGARQAGPRRRAPRRAQRGGGGGRAGGTTGVALGAAAATRTTAAQPREATRPVEPAADA